MAFTGDLIGQSNFCPMTGRPDNWDNPSCNEYVAPDTRATGEKHGMRKFFKYILPLGLIVLSVLAVSRDGHDRQEQTTRTVKETTDQTVRVDAIPAEVASLNFSVRFPGQRSDPGPKPPWSQKYPARSYLFLKISSPAVFSAKGRCCCRSTPAITRRACFVPRPTWRHAKRNTPTRKRALNRHSKTGQTWAARASLQT